LGHGRYVSASINLLYPAPPAIPRPGKPQSGPEALVGFVAGSAAVEPDVAQQAIVQVGQLAA
jgi:hypothetical protein